jgi:ArsR family transcriptional regulator
MERVLQSDAKRWELYRLLSEPVRLRLLALAAEEELTIGELAELIGEAQPKVSRHLKGLRAAHLLSVRRQGTRTLVRLADAINDDPVVRDALAAGRNLCRADGSLRRVAEVVEARDVAVRMFFDAAPGDAPIEHLPRELPAYLSAVGMLLPRRRLAIDVGTGSGGLLDVIAPVFDRVIALDRSEAQLALARERLSRRGYGHVEVRRTEYDDPSLRLDVESAGGADVVFASRVLHHAPKPAIAMQALSRLARPGGALVVIDYAPHEDERLREHQADLWLGFAPAELVRYAASAGLEGVVVHAIPSRRCGDGPDGHLDWQVMCARRPPGSAN